MAPDSGLCSSCRLILLSILLLWVPETPVSCTPVSVVRNSRSPGPSTRASGEETGGFLRAQCPRPEDIHPCTCILMPKHVDEDDEGEDEGEEERRFARSASFIQDLEFRTPDAAPYYAPPLPPSTSWSTHEPEAEVTTTVLPSSDSDPEIGTTTIAPSGEAGGEAVEVGAEVVVDAATTTPAPRFRVVVVPSERLVRGSPADAAPATVTIAGANPAPKQAAASDEVDITMPTLSPVRDEEDEMKYSHEPTVDTTPPPMHWLSSDSHLSPRFTLSPASVSNAPPADNNSSSDPELVTTTTPEPTTTITPPQATSTTTATTTTTTSTTTTTTPAAKLETSTPVPAVTTGEPAPASPLALVQVKPSQRPSSSPAHESHAEPVSPPAIVTEPTTPASTNDSHVPPAPTSEKRIMTKTRPSDESPVVGGTSDRSQDHWSLWESMLVCRNIRSSRVIADTLKSMKGYHFNFVVLDNVKLPQPFPFSLFNRFSFDFLELLNIGSLQFVENFSDNRREYYYGRSQRGSSEDVRRTNDSFSASASSPHASWSPAPAAGSSGPSRVQRKQSRRRRRK